MLCAAADDITQRMKKDPVAAGSGVCSDLRHHGGGQRFPPFQNAGRIGEGTPCHGIRFSIPLDYRNNCLLYLPQIPPRQRVEDTDVYFNELTAELVGLIKAASGHALVLFTSLRSHVGCEGAAAGGISHSHC